MYETIAKRVSPAAFVEPQWRLAAEPVSMQDVEHRVSDIAFELAAIFEQEESSLSSGQDTPERLGDFIERLDEVDSKLTDLIATMKSMPYYFNGDGHDHFLGPRIGN